MKAIMLDCGGVCNSTRTECMTQGKRLSNESVYTPKKFINVAVNTKHYDDALPTQKDRPDYSQFLIASIKFMVPCRN